MTMTNMKTWLAAGLTAIVVATGCGGGGGAGGAAGGGTTTVKGAPVGKKPMSKVAAKAAPPPEVKAAGPVVEMSDNDKAKFDKAAKAYADLEKEAQATGWNSGLCSRAAAVWEGLANSAPKMVEARFNVGASYSHCHEDAKAEAAYKAAIAINGAYAPAFANIGEIYLRGGAPDKAKPWFDNALKADPNNAAAHNNLAWMLYQKLRVSTVEAERTRLEDEVLGHLRTALAVEADNLEAFNTFALVYLEGSENNASRLDIAQLLIDQAKKKNDKFAPLYVTSGLLALKRKNVSMALSDFNKAIVLDPNLTEARMNVGSLGISFRKYDDAKAQFEAVLKKEPKNYEAKVGLGVALRGLAAVQKDTKILDDAEKTYKDAQAMQPSAGAAYYNLGLLYANYRLVILNPDDYDGQIDAATKAVGFFTQFKQKGGPPDKIKDAGERIDDLNKLIQTFKEIKALPPEPPAEETPPPAPAPAPGAPAPGATPAPAGGNPK